MYSPYIEDVGSCMIFLVKSYWLDNKKGADTAAKGPRLSSTMNSIPTSALIVTK
ncbi:predicted protein [Botrytis cinerea T4]|uniref:Uncharacterized protein n=1 Tax=Botryotinia fuckeliana (strain T4) TaxID=999810 RepID=G2YU22_BOTF4|nr:predicted protein [Botrytis cinerea T4]